MILYPDRDIYCQVQSILTLFITSVNMSWKTYIGGLCTEPISSTDKPMINRDPNSHTRIEFDEDRIEYVPTDLRISVIED